ncbi:nitroreductase [Salibacterium salarium]|uniref:Putative NAD(P)H nitroreductase n=1 Tax=Salibacterium salarium TaxID=284579 RepID=A0A428MTZ6_9BACI|nr:nitroreductase [Salibacterium salarium]RSL29598.1 nitroreductase [Salibacterium salarium]
MELTEGLLKRRTIYSFKKDDVDLEIIEKALDCAVMAPNHKMTEPWHFYAVRGKTKEKLAERKKELKWEGFLDQDSERAQRAGEAAYTYIAELPWVMVVTTHRYSVDPVREKEDYAATSCAVQNFQLAAWAEGVGSKWSTGQFVKDQKVRDIVGAGEEEEIVGVIYLGYPEEIPNPKKRHRKEMVSWLE